MLTGVSATFSRWTIHWYPAEMQPYREWYILKEYIDHDKESRNVFYTPYYQVTDPHRGVAKYSKNRSPKGFFRA